MIQDPKLWAELETEFSAISEGPDSLAASWKRLLPPGEADSAQGAKGVWKITGGFLPSEKSRFCALAFRAANALTDAETVPVQLEDWLNALRLRGGVFVVETRSAKNLAKGTGERFNTGRIDRLCEASARYCEELASRCWGKLWQINRDTLNRSIELLARTPGFSIARSNLYETTEPLIVEMQQIPIPRLRARDLFDANASSMLPLVRDEETRGAYLNVLRDIYYTQAHEFLVGAPSELHAHRFGGPGVKQLSEPFLRLVQELDARFRFWVTAAYKHGSSPNAAEGEARPSATAHPETESSESLKRNRKGDLSLIEGKKIVTFATAERYLGISERQRQNLMRTGALAVEGRGSNKKITTASLIAYLPPETPK